MSHEYKLNLILKDTSDTITLSGQFTDAEWVSLEDFVRYSDDLSNTDLIKAGDWGELKIQWEQGSMTVSARLPDWGPVIVFLHKLRPLLLQNESTNFYKICNMLARQLAHPYVRNILAQHRDLYSGKTMQSGIRISHDDVLINSERVLFDWLNSYEYHRETEKRRFIESLHRMIPLDASKVVFLRLLAYKADGVFNLAAFSRVVLGTEKSIKAMVLQR